MTPDWYDAATRGDAARLRALAAAGTDMDARDRHGQTALMLAAHAGHRDAVAALLALGADRDVSAKYGLTALMLAVVGGHADVAALLARNGAERTRRGSGAPGFAGKTARDLALAAGRTELARELVEPETVLSFWFGDAADDPAAALARQSFWFTAAPDTDRAIAADFGAAVETAAAGALDGWRANARGALALVLLLDQFPRSIHRGTAAAFRYDPSARAIARGAIDMGALDALGPVERCFLVMPFEHGEARDDQRECVRLAEKIAAEAPEPWRAVTAAFLAAAHEHAAIIERFGRFPHRNAVLARASTPEEIVYLEATDRRFGQ